MDKVLIVDDDQILLQTLQQGLQKYTGQFEVLKASSGKKALAVLERERISVLITDLDMPKMDGLELLAHMRRNRPQIPCVVMTESESPEIKNEADREHIFHCLQKPLDLNELFAVIMEGLDRIDEGIFWREYRKESE